MLLYADFEIHKTDSPTWLSLTGDPVHPPTHSQYLFIFTSWGRVSWFPCRCSLLLPLFLSLSLVSLLVSGQLGLGAGGGVVRGWGGAAGNFVCVFLCVRKCVCALARELIKDGDPWKALSKDTVNYLMPGPDRRAHSHTHSLCNILTHPPTHTPKHTPHLRIHGEGAVEGITGNCVYACGWVCICGKQWFIKLLSLLTNLCNSSWKV